MSALTDWLKYNNTGATRNQPLSPELVEALGSFLPDMGLGVEVFSGGQPTSGPHRVGSHRHDLGGAGDMFITRNGDRVGWDDPDNIPLLQDVVRRARAAGITGIGAGEGYMQPGSMHMGFGPPSAWGDGGKSANAPKWLRDAFNAQGPLPGISLASLPADGPKGQESFPAMAPPLPPAYNVADRPIGDTMPAAFDGGSTNPIEGLLAGLKTATGGGKSDGFTQLMSAFGGGGSSAPSGPPKLAPSSISSDPMEPQRMAQAQQMMQQLLNKRRKKVPGLSLMG